MSLISELQSDSINERISLEALLRKAYLVSRKLELNDFSDIITKELEGYRVFEEDNSDCESIPNYRLVKGCLKSFNPVYGWTPVIIDDQSLEQAITVRYMHQSVSELQDLYNADVDPIIYLSGEMNTRLSKGTDGILTQFGIFLSHASIGNILNSVRNLILRWALDLESAGITGDGLQFSEQEIATANTNTEIHNYINNFYNSVDGVQIQQGTIDSNMDA